MTIQMYLPDSNNPFAIVGGNSNNVSNGNAGVSYLNNNSGNANDNYGGRSVPVPCQKMAKTDLGYDFLAPWQKMTKIPNNSFSIERERPVYGLKTRIAVW